jgi:hypothetical protein
MEQPYPTHKNKSKTYFYAVIDGAKTDKKEKNNE